MRVSFFAEHRARRVQQSASSRERRPQAVEECALLRREAGHVGRAPQPLAVRVPAHDTRGRARHVGQNAIERRAVPPAGRLRRVGLREANMRSVEPEPGDVVAYARKPRCVGIERREFDVGFLQQM